MKTRKLTGLWQGKNKENTSISQAEASSADVKKKQCQNYLVIEISNQATLVTTSMEPALGIATKRSSETKEICPSQSGDMPPGSVR